MATRPERWIRRLTFAAGLPALISWQAPRAERLSRLELTVHVNPTGEVGVTPSGRVLNVRGLGPRRPARTAVELRNLTGARLAVRARVAVATRDVDDLPHVRLAAGPRRLYNGSLRRLRDRTTPRLALGSGRRRRLSVTLYVPRAADGGLVGPRAT